MPCEECRRLALDLASATVEAVAIARDIAARRDISPTLRHRAADAETNRRQALAAIREHRSLHTLAGEKKRERAKLGSLPVSASSKK
jgi:hypothetical protein